MSELAEDDEEDDEGRDPAVELVVVDDFVAEEGDEEGRSCDDNDACKAGKIVIHSVEELGANYDVDGGPTNASEDVEDGDDLRAVPAEVEAGEYHLTEAKNGSESREKADGGYSEEVDEEDGEQSVDETELEDVHGENSNGKT